MSDSKFIRFKQFCTDLRLQTTNCEKSQIKFNEAKSVPEAVAALRMFWVSVVNQIPAEFIDVLDSIYSDYRDDMNAAGVYYNEAPSNHINALIFVGNCKHELSFLKGRPRVIVLGAANIVIGDHVRCECYHKSATIQCLEYSRLDIKEGTAFAKDHSCVNGSGEIYSHDLAKVHIHGGNLYDRGHIFIKAYNDAIVHSFTHRKIELTNQAQLKLYE